MKNRVELSIRELELIEQAIRFYRKEVAKDDKEYFNLGYKVGCSLAYSRKMKEYGLVETKYDKLLEKAVNRVKEENGQRFAESN